MREELCGSGHSLIRWKCKADIAVQEELKNCCSACRVMIRPVNNIWHFRPRKQAVHILLTWGSINILIRRKSESIYPKKNKTQWWHIRKCHILLANRNVNEDYKYDKWIVHTSLAHIFLVVKNEENIPELCLFWGKIPSIRQYKLNKRGKQDYGARNEKDK